MHKAQHEGAEAFVASMPQAERMDAERSAACPGTRALVTLHPGTARGLQGLLKKVLFRFGCVLGFELGLFGFAKSMISDPV